MAKQKNIFKTLRNYGDGFHGNNSAESNAIYDAKISEVTARILADVEHAPEIIADEFGKCEARKWREAFTNGYLTPRHDAEWAAINHISYALMDSKPLDKSEPKEIKTHADLVAFMVETEEYNEQGATEAIKNYMDERIAEGMTVAAAFRATIEFMQNTLGDNYELSYSEKWKIQNSSHQWEISEGSTHTRIHLRVEKDERGYYLLLSGGLHCRTAEVVRMYNALIENGYPVRLYGHQKIADALMELDDVGIVPISDTPSQYWYGGFPQSDVISFINLSDEIFTEDEIRQIVEKATWLDMPLLTLKTE